MSRWLALAALIFSQVALAAPEKLAALLIDESSQQVFVLPVPRAVGGVASAGWVAGDPFPQSKGADPKILVESVSNPLAQRLGAYAELAKRALPPVSWDSGLSYEVVGFLQELRKFSGSIKRENSGFWPPVIPLTLMDLSRWEGIVLIFGVQTARHGLEKVDFMRVSQGELTRVYWSRTIDDPVRFRSTAEVITDLTQRFVDQVRGKLRKPIPGDRLILAVDQRISEIDLTAVQKVVQDLLQDRDAPLVPIDVSGGEVRYRSELARSQEVTLFDALGKIGGGFSVRRVPGQVGVIQLQSTASVGKVSEAGTKK